MRKGFLALLLFAQVAFGAGSYVTFSFTNSVGQPDTNAFRVIPISGPVANADGSFTTIGLPIKVSPDSNGYAIKYLAQNNWLATNQFLGSGIVFRVPDGAVTNSMYDLRISGFNTFVTILINTNANSGGGSGTTYTNDLTGLPGVVNPATASIGTNLSSLATVASLGTSAYSNAAAFTTPAQALQISTNMLPQNLPRDQNRSYDYLRASGCNGWDTTNANGDYYRASSGNYSNVFFGGVSSAAAACTYTNANGWVFTYPGDGANNFYLSNNLGVLMWHHSRGSLLATANISAWGNYINAQGAYFPFAYNDGTTNAGPLVSSGYTNYDATVLSSYQKIVVFDGDSRMAGWPANDNWGATHPVRLIAGRPFFKNAYLTNFGVGGVQSTTVSNNYASKVYPLRPQAGQTGFYVVWTMANGDTPASVTNVLKPLFKQAKKDGWIIVPILNYPIPSYEANNSKAYGQDVYDGNCALRAMNGRDGAAGYWDILIDMESRIQSLHDAEVNDGDRLHPNRVGMATRIADYIAQRIEQGTTVDASEFNITPPLVWGTYDKYSQTNVVIRTHPQYGNFLTKGAPFIAGDGFGIATNLPPAIPQSPGATFYWNSNGTATYELWSSKDGQVWVSTNLWGSGGGGWTGNPNQFSGGSTTNIKSGFIGTNFNLYGTTILKAVSQDDIQLTPSLIGGPDTLLTIQSSSNPWAVPVMMDSTGVVAVAFSGAGSNLTGLNANNLASGTVPVARIPNPIFTNTSQINYIWTNAVAGTWLGIVPGIGEMKSNAITGAFSVWGTNAGFTIGGSNVANAGQLVIIQSNNAATSPVGIALTNSVVATSGNPKASPGYWVYGHGYNTSGGTDAPLGFGFQVIPTSAATAASYFVISNNAGLDIFRLKNTGSLDMDNGNIGLSTGGVAAGAGASSAAQGQVSVWSGAQRGVLNTLGVTLQSTAGFKITSTANSQGTVVLGLFRNSDNFWEVDSGTLGDYRGMILKDLIATNTIIATNGVLTVTNTLNTGVIPVGQVLYTNLTGNITIGGWSGIVAGYSNPWRIVATNGTASDYSITFPAGVVVPRNGINGAGTRVFWVTNYGTTFLSGCAELGQTNVGAASEVAAP